MTPPSDQHGPIRTCVGCRTRRPQADLLRCVLDADGTVCLGRRAPGRGVWLCGIGCFEEAHRRGGFARGFRCAVRAEQLEQLRDELTRTGTD